MEINIPGSKISKIIQVNLGSTKGDLGSTKEEVQMKEYHKRSKVGLPEAHICTKWPSGLGDWYSGVKKSANMKARQKNQKTTYNMFPKKVKQKLKSRYIFICSDIYIDLYIHIFFFCTRFTVSAGLSMGCQVCEHFCSKLTSSWVVSSVENFEGAPDDLVLTEQ